jgi:hypothetical protein
LFLPENTNRKPVLNKENRRQRLLGVKLSDFGAMSDFWARAVERWKSEMG